MAKAKLKLAAVVVTTIHKGVFFGYTTPDNQDKTVKLTGARNCLYWPSAIGGFIGLAATGPNSETKVGPVANITLHDVTSVLECTEIAEKAWLATTWRF